MTEAPPAAAAPGRRRAGCATWAAGICLLLVGGCCVQEWRIDRARRHVGVVLRGYGASLGGVTPPLPANAGEWGVGFPADRGPLSDADVARIAAAFDTPAASRHIRVAAPQGVMTDGQAAALLLAAPSVRVVRLGGWGEAQYFTRDGGGGIRTARD